MRASPYRVLAAAVLLVVLSLLATWRWLGFELDRTGMLGARHPEQQRWRAYQREFGNSPDFLVLVQGPAPQAQKALDWLAGRLEAEPEVFHRVLYRLDLRGLGRKALYYLPLPDLRRLHDALRQASPFLATLARPDGLGRLLQRPFTRQDVEPQLGLLTSLADGLLRTLESRGRNAYRSLLAEYQPPPATYYTRLGDGHVLLVGAKVVPGSHAGEVRAYERLEGLVAHLRLAYPDLEASVSGDTAMNVEDMQTAIRDAVQSGVLALVLVTLVLALGLGSLSRPLKLMAALLCGLSWSFGFAALVVGELNLLTVMFATILVALGMTFGIDALLQEGRMARRQDLVGVASTAVAFYSLYFTRFEAAAELGVIVGTGILFIYLSMVTVLPALLALERRPRAPVRFPALQSLDRRLGRRSGLVLAAAAVVTLYSATWLVSVPFDYNILNLQPPGSEVLVTERFLRDRGYSTLFAVSVAPNMEEARRRAAELRALPTVSRVESPTDLLPEQIEGKRPLVQRTVLLAQSLKLPSTRPPTSAPALERLAADFVRLRERLDPILRAIPDARALRVALVELGELPDTLGPGPLASGLELFVRRVREEARRQVLFLRTQSVEPPDPNVDLPAAVRQRSLGRSGQVALRIFPRHDVWGLEPLEQFVRQLRRVDPQVTGVPVLLHTYLVELRQAYQVAARNAFLVICVLLLLHFRSFRRAGLAMTPKLLGIVWMLAIMGLFGTDFNVANFLAMPLTLGIGLVFGVQVIQSEELFGGATGPTIVLSGSTIIIGFGTLLLAQHRAIASLGAVLLAGIGTTLLATLLVMPALQRSWRLNESQLSPR